MIIPSPCSIQQSLYYAFDLNLFSWDTEQESEADWDVHTQTIRLIRCWLWSRWDSSRRYSTAADNDDRWSRKANLLWWWNRNGGRARFTQPFPRSVLLITVIRVRVYWQLTTSRHQIFGRGPTSRQHLQYQRMAGMWVKSRISLVSFVYHLLPKPTSTTIPYSYRTVVCSTYTEWSISLDGLGLNDWLDGCSTFYTALCTIGQRC